MVLKIDVRPEDTCMSIETYASRRLAAEVLQTYNYKCGVLPVLETASEGLEEFVIRVSADDPVFPWGTKREGDERFPVGFMYAKLRDGSYVIVASEEESAVELAERVKKLADEYLASDASERIAMTA
jgi:hypothetical protein